MWEDEDLGRERERGKDEKEGERKEGVAVGEKCGKVSL